MKLKTGKKILGIGVWFAGLLAFSAAQATPIITLTFDENGNETGTYVSNPPGTPIGFLASRVDNLTANVQIGGGSQPGGGGASTLAYLFPSANSTFFEYGWVVVYTPGTPSADYGKAAYDADIVDLIHFDNSATISGTTYTDMFYYSKEGSGNLANNWVSSSTLSTILSDTPNTAYVTESQSGLITYNPTTYTYAVGNTTPGEAPGYGISYSGGVHVTSQQYQFDFLSQVPDGGMTVALLGLSLVGLVGAEFLRRKSAS